MTEEKFVYVYGKNKEESFWELVVYNNRHDFVNEKKPIGSLEGIFVSSQELKDEKISKKMGPHYNLLLNRSSMGWFEEEYNGKFFPFEERIKLDFDNNKE